MKKSIFLTVFICLFTIQGQLFSWIYMWEANNEGSVSCCLHISDVNICNPHKACTRYIQADLSGILDYVMRMLAIDKSALEPHHTLLVQIKQYIRSALNNPYYSIEYRLNERGSVRFYHEVLEAAHKSKDAKATSQAKPVKDDTVARYLIKYGFMKTKHKL